MKSWIVLLALVLFIGCRQEFTSQNRTISGSVVGGHDVDPFKTDISFMVSIGGDCGATIIAPKWLLTAAHCEPVFGGPITAGGIDLESKDRIRLRMKRYIVHPDYSSNDASNDFALIELVTPIDFIKTKLSALTLSDPEFVNRGGIDPGVVATVFGWGDSLQRPALESILQTVDVPIISRERANRSDSYNGKIDESMIVAGYEEGKRDACSGDSGGPLVTYDSVLNVTRLIGVVSWGQGCAWPKYFGVYSNVAHAHAWIMESIEQF